MQLNRYIILRELFAKNDNLETKFPSSIGSGNVSSLDWYFSQIPLPNMIYLFIILSINLFRISKVMNLLSSKQEQFQSFFYTFQMIISSIISLYTNKFFLHLLGCQFDLNLVNEYT